MTPAALLVDLPVTPEEYTVRIVEGLTARRDEVDRLLAGHSAGWAIDRMPAVDRALLRAATYELIGELDVPTAVVIDEAIELAKEYSTEDSGRFLNGVLASIAAEVRSATAS
jgi:N utilization substance protein B